MSWEVHQLFEGSHWLPVIHSACVLWWNKLRNTYQNSGIQVPAALRPFHYWNLGDHSLLRYVPVSRANCERVSFAHLLFTSHTAPPAYVSASCIAHTAAQTGHTFHDIPSKDWEFGTAANLLCKFQHWISERNRRVAFMFAIRTSRKGGSVGIVRKVPAAYRFCAVCFRTRLSKVS